jgi:hypothetical protein
VPLHQYVYFAFRSPDFSAAEMSEFLGIEPDEVGVRGSRITVPEVIPACHSWKLACREPDLRVDEQIACVLNRLRPHADRLVALSDRLSDGGAVLEVVRSFNDADQLATPDGPNIFGWFLERETMEFLIAVGAALDVDEYDFS